VDVHKGEGGVQLMWTHVDREEVKKLIFCGCHKWMAPYVHHLFRPRCRLTCW